FAPSMYDFCLFNAITNGIDLKDPIDKIRHDLEQAYLKITNKENIEASMEAEIINFFNLLEETRNNNAYVVYGLKIKDLVGKRGWEGLYNAYILEPTKAMQAKAFIADLQHQNVNDVVKAVAQAISKITIENCDELLLSGILDVEELSKNNARSNSRGAMDSIDNTTRQRCKLCC
ncbi:13430_t:CDS:2, partial [Racocetra persica]